MRIDPHWIVLHRKRERPLHILSSDALKTWGEAVSEVANLPADHDLVQVIRTTGAPRTLVDDTRRAMVDAAGLKRSLARLAEHDVDFILPGCGSGPDVVGPNPDYKWS